MDEFIQSIEGNFRFMLFVLWILVAAGGVTSGLAADSDSLSDVYDYRKYIWIASVTLLILAIIAQNVYIYLY